MLGCFDGEGEAGDAGADDKEVGHGGSFKVQGSRFKLDRFGGVLCLNGEFGWNRGRRGTTRNMVEGEMLSGLGEVAKRWRASAGGYYLGEGSFEVQVWRFKKDRMMRRVVQVAVRIQLDLVRR